MLSSYRNRKNGHRAAATQSGKASSPSIVDGTRTFEHASLHIDRVTREAYSECGRGDLDVVLEAPHKELAVPGVDLKRLGARRTEIDGKVSS